MLRLTISALILLGVSTPALADCATAGLRVRCLYVGPDDSAQNRSQIGARFVTAARPSDTAAEGQPAAGHRVKAAAPRAPKVPVLARGDLLPEDVLILMNPIRYGLPRPQDGWTYFTVGDAIYRADIHTRRVLNYINPHINRY